MWFYFNYHYKAKLCWKLTWVALYMKLVNYTILLPWLFTTATGIKALKFTLCISNPHFLYSGFIIIVSHMKCWINGIFMPFYQCIISSMKMNSYAMCGKYGNKFNFPSFHDFPEFIIPCGKCSMCVHNIYEYIMWH